MIIAIDFDGTCVTHEFPAIGNSIGAVEVLKKLIDHNHQLVLFTMRSGVSLHEAVEWFKKNDIQLYGIQYNPTQTSWTSSNKCYAHLYIDDAALGCPLIFDESRCIRPFVDWLEVYKILIQKGFIKE